MKRALAALLAVALIATATASFASTAYDHWGNPPLAHVWLAPAFARDCSVDVTAQLEGWLAQVPDGDTAVLAPEACYQVGSLYLAGRHGLTIDGNGATLRRGVETDTAVFEVDGSTDVTVEGLHVVGSNPTGAGFNPGNAFESGFHFEADQRLTLVGLSSDASWGDGVTLGGEHVGQEDVDVTVSGLTVTNAGRQGVTIGTARGVVVDRATVSSYANGFDLEVNGDTGASGIEIAYSTITSRGVAIAANGVWPANEVYVHDNTIVVSLLSWPAVSVGENPGALARSDWRVERNTVLQPREAPGIVMGGVARVVVRDNLIPLENPPNPYILHYPGVQLSGSPNAVVTGNGFVGGNAVYVGDPPAVNCGNSLTGPGSPC